MPYVDDTIVTIIKNAPAITAYIGTTPAPRFFPDTIGVNATRPAIAYQRISDPRVKSLHGDSGLGRARFQLTIFARNAAERKAMIAALRQTLEPYSDRYTGGVIDNISYDDARDQYDPTTKDYMSFVDFLIWHVEI